MEYLFVKWIHILSSTVLFGTGIGSAFYLLVSTLQREVRVALGFLAFFAFLAIFWLMVARQSPW